MKQVVLHSQGVLMTHFRLSLPQARNPHKPWLPVKLRALSPPPPLTFSFLARLRRLGPRRLLLSKAWFWQVSRVGGATRAFITESQKGPQRPSSSTVL